MDGIAEALNTTFKMDVSKEIKEEKSLKSQLVEMDSKKKEIQSRLVIEDKEVIKAELMEMLSSVQDIRRILEENLRRPPLKSSDVETYSMVVGQITTLIRELRQLNMDVVNVEMNQRKMDYAIDKQTGSVVNNTTNNVLMVSSKDLDAMINNAKENSRLNEIDATFDVSVVK